MFIIKEGNEEFLMRGKYFNGRRFWISVWDKWKILIFAIGGIRDGSNFITQQVLLIGYG